VDPGDLEANTPANRVLLRFSGVAEPESAAVDALIERAYRTRSDLLQLSLRRELEEARADVARTELLPTASAFFNYSYSAQENGALNFFGENDTQRTSSAAVGVRIDVPIFSGLQRYSRIAQRQIAVRQVESQLADLRLKAASEVRTRHDQVGEARARAEAQRQAVAEARRGFEIASSRYREGTGTRLDVTDAENALRQAELNYAQAAYDYLAARAELDLAVGQVPAVDDALAVIYEDPGEALPGPDELDRPGMD
jgi:outer membrane protein TolC